MPVLVQTVVVAARRVATADACRAGAASAVRQAAARLRRRMRRGASDEDTLAQYALDVLRGMREESNLVLLFRDVTRRRARGEDPWQTRRVIAVRVATVLSSLLVQPRLVRDVAAWLLRVLGVAPLAGVARL